jgi:hypothetical protein
VARDATMPTPSNASSTRRGMRIRAATISTSGQIT